MRQKVVFECHTERGRNVRPLLQQQLLLLLLLLLPVLALVLLLLLLLRKEQKRCRRTFQVYYGCRGHHEDFMLPGLVALLPS